MNARDYSKVGGKKTVLRTGRRRSEEEVWNFGWIPPEARTHWQECFVEEAKEAMPKFEIIGTKRNDPDRVNLYELWKHPTVVAANGWEFTGTHQLTGSCVGAGGGNALMTLACAEVVLGREAETPLLPFWLLPYGRSRFYLGMKSPGEGSSGTTFAKSAREDGVLAANATGLPTFTRTDGFVWGERVEYSWSDGDAAQTMEKLAESRTHLVKTTAQCKDHNDVREAIRNGYPVTCASNYAHRPSVTSDPPVLLGKKSGSWSHQMSIQAWWRHPKLGEVFWLMNQWGLNAHGKDPAGGPLGGVWITSADVDWICRDEVFAFSQYQGFPAQTFDLYV